MELIQEPNRGYALLQGGGDIDELARALNTGIVRHVPRPMQVSKAKGATKAFSFHWSNAQGKWDVISVREFPWGLDGAEFFLFIGSRAISPLGRPWSLAEMQYVAKKLHPHPGFGGSAEGLTRRVASRWIRSIVTAGISGPSDSVVDRILKVTADFSRVDEWHITTLKIHLALQTSKPVPSKQVETWVKSHWREVQVAAPRTTPAPAGPPSRYASWGDDEYDDGTTDWMLDYPAEGLGWVAPNRMTWNDVEDHDWHQTGNKGVFSATASIR